MLNKLKKWLASEEENEFPCPFTNKILQYSKELDWKIVIHSESHITVGFAFDDDRSQLVHIFDAGTMGDEPVVQISSPAASLEALGDQLTQDLMNELLRLNADAPNYSWAIETIADGDYLIASSDQLLNTIDVGELASAVYAVASAADKMESRFGLDNF